MHMVLIDPRCAQAWREYNTGLPTEHGNYVRVRELDHVKRTAPRFYVIGRGFRISAHAERPV